MLVLLHGFGGHPEAWGPTIAGLPGGAAILTSSLPGHDPNFELGLGAHFEDARLALSARLPARFDLLGYSLGARLALSLALSEPERVNRLFLIGVRPGLADPEARETRRQADAAWARLLREEGLGPFFARWDQNPLFAGRARAPLERRRALEQWRGRLDPEQLARALETMGLAEMPNLAPRLGELEADTKLLVGEDDLEFGRIAAEMSLKMPRAAVHTIAGAGHDVPFEAPEALAAFLRQECVMG